MPLVTVTFSTFRESYLKLVLKLLHSLENQTMTDFEVLIVVNRNQRYFEKLRSEVGGELKTGQKITLIFNPIDKGIAHSRNIALASACNPYIVFTDDDVIPDKGWLKNLTATLDEYGDAGAVTGPVLANWQSDALKFSKWFPKELYWIIGCTFADITETKKVRNGFGSNLGLKREFAIKCGGFNELFGYNQTDPFVGEEVDCGIRLRQNGKFTLWNPNAIVYHRVSKERLYFKNILVRSFVEGKTKAYLTQLYGNEALEKEITHLELLIKSFVKPQPFRASVFSVASTLAVFVSYFGYRSLFVFARIRK